MNANSKEQTPLSRSSPCLARLALWSRERFPVVNFISSYLLYFMTAAIARSILNGGGTAIRFSALDLAGGLALGCHFLILRVLDEHKDYVSDLRNFPERVLQRGLVTLGELRGVGIVALVVQMIVTLWLTEGAPPALLAYFAMLGWTALMTKEFFCAEWLRRHPVVYAVSHMLIMPFTIGWVAHLAAPRIGAEPLGGLMLLVFTSGLLYEVARKSMGREEESPGIDSYSGIFGVKGSAAILIILGTLVLAEELCELARISATSGIVLKALVGVGFTLCALAALRYGRAPSAHARKKNEAMGGLFMLINYASLLWAAIAAHGLTLSAR